MYSFFNCRSMKLVKLMNEFEMERIANRCSVVKNLADNQCSRVGEGVSGERGGASSDNELILLNGCMDFDSTVGSKLKSIKLNELFILLRAGSVAALLNAGTCSALKLNVTRLAGNMTNTWAPRDIRPNAIGCLGLLMPNLTSNRLSSWLSMDHTCRLERRILVSFRIDWA